MILDSFNLEENMDNEHTSPMVSVIMPAYNSQRFVSQAVASVLAQTVSDLELIVIDDASTDATKATIEALAQKDSRIVLVENESNIGVAKTRNRGLELCRGKYVALLDSDDYWKPQILERMIARAEETGADIVFCSYEIVDENGQKCCNDFLVPDVTTFQDSIVRSVITCSTVLMTRSLAENHRFPTNVYHEDIALWFQILRDGGKAFGVQEVLASYRQTSSSRSSGKLTSAIRRWVVYRKHLRMPLLASARAMVRYAYFGLIKYRRI